MTNIVYLVLGAVLLIAGRRLFWLLVGGIGFVIGASLATRFFHGSDLTVLLAGLVLGIIFGALAVFLESIAIGIAGFLGGGYILVSLADMLGINNTGLSTGIIFVIGGIIGVILVTALFNWALITISSLTGASMIVSAFSLTAATAGVIYLVLVIAGVLIQGTSMRRERRATA